MSVLTKSEILGKLVKGELTQQEAMVLLDRVDMEYAIDKRGFFTAKGLKSRIHTTEVGTLRGLIDSIELFVKDTTVKLGAEATEPTTTDNTVLLESKTEAEAPAAAKAA